MKRMAAQIAGQLPEDRTEALTVLNYAREIICNLGVGWEVPSPMAAVVPIVPLRLVSDKSG